MDSPVTQSVDVSATVPEEWRQWYFAAAGRWSTVAWTSDQFHHHLTIVLHEHTRHPEDLFLSGAAGFEMSDAWSVIYEELSSDVIRCLRKMRVPGQEPTDLWSQAIARLLKPSVDFPIESFVSDPGCKIPPSKIVEFQGRSSLRNYVLLIAQNIGRDYVRKKELNYDQSDIEQASNGRSQSNEYEGVELSPDESRKVQQVLKDAMCTLTANERKMLQAVAVLGLNNLEASKFLNISASSATRYRQSATESLQRAIQTGLESFGEMDDRVLDGSIKFLKRTLQSMQDDSSTSLG